MKYRQDRGVIMVMAAIFISVMLMLASVAFFVLQRATAKEQWGSVWNVIGLAGLQEYFKVDCEALNLTGLACHGKKFDDAVVRMQEISDANSHLVTSLEVFKTGDSEPEGNYLKVTAGRYYYKKISENADPCNDSYPCFKPLSPSAPDEYANSFEITGKVKHGRFTHFIFTNLTGGTRNLDLEITRRIAAVPFSIAITIDLSLSVQASNHSADRTPPVGGPELSYYSYRFLNDLDPSNRIIVPAEVKTDWDNLSANRPAEVKPWDFHYKDDYVPITVYNENSDYAIYPQKSHHAEPDGSGSDDPAFYLINAHRSAQTGYHGPEPFLSIIRGAKKGLGLVRERGVHGDSVSLIGYNNYIPWRNIIKRTTDFSYLEQVLDDSAISSGAMYVHPNNAPLSLVPKTKDDPTVPLFIRLGLFPTPASWTDTLLGLTKAVTQVSSGMGEIPTVKAIMLFTDGMVNCSPTQLDAGHPRCRDWYAHYKAGMKDLTYFVQDELAENGIALHTFMVGSAAHYLAIPVKPPGQAGTGYGVEGAQPGECMTDAQARGLNVPFVQGQNFAADSDGQLAWENKHNVPFFQAAYDSYVLTRMTGGRWGALLSVADGCVPNTTYCSDPSNYFKRVQFDPLCRTIDQQVADYIEDVVVNSKTFAVVE